LGISALAGWLAGLILQDGGFGLLGDVVGGMIGAFLNGVLVVFLVHGAAIGVFASTLVAVLGAVVCVSLMRALTVTFSV
jgi:uncharacterized membrane protein YeaQ/YmgE (transglycosylase-associated protein family)